MGIEMTASLIRRGLPSLGLTVLAALAVGGSAAAGPLPKPDPDSRPTVVPIVRYVPVDDNAIEPAQVGAGVLGGALIGGGAVATRRRRGARVATPTS